MKPTKKQLKEIQEIEKKVANVCDANDSVIYKITGLVNNKKKIIEVTINENGVIINIETGKPLWKELNEIIKETKK